MSPCPLRMDLRPRIRGSHSEFAVTQLLVDLPTKFGHVLLGEAERLRQGQVLAVLGVNKAGHENHLLSIPIKSGPVLHISYETSHRIFQRTSPYHKQKGVKVPQPGGVKKKSDIKASVLTWCMNYLVLRQRKHFALGSGRQLCQNQRPSVGWESQETSEIRVSAF